MQAWLDGLSISQRRLAFAVAAFALVGWALLLVPWPDGGRPRAGAPALPASAAALPAPTPTPTGPPAPAALAEGDDRSDQRTRPLASSELQAARRVAAAFVRQYASWRWDETPADEDARLRPYVTDRLFASLTSDSGATATRAAREQRRQVARATVLHLQPLLISARRVQLLAVVEQQVAGRDGRTQTTPSYTVDVVPDGDAWRVAWLQV